MSLFRKISALFRRDHLDAEMSEELQFHLEEQAEINRRAGMSPAEARLAAQRQFGHIDGVKETARDQRGWIWLEQGLQDLRFAVRTLRKNAGFTTVVALTLALGIGLNTVVFTFYSAVALKPLAVRAPAEIVRVLTIDGLRTETQFTAAEFAGLATHAQSFAAMVATSAPQSLPVAQLDARAPRPEMADVRFVSENYFSALGVGSTLGRGFDGNDGAAAVLSHDFWLRRYAGNPVVVGQTLVIRGVPVTILGVAPESFAGTGLPANTPDLWLPRSLQPAMMPNADWLRGNARPWQVLARRRPGVTLEQANAELRVLSHARPAEGRRPTQIVARPATFFQTDTGEFQSFRVVVLIVMVAVGTILLIGCVNVVNLLAARNSARGHELAVRLALGAGRGRIVRQLCTESVLLGLLGGAGGLALSYWFCSVARAWIVGTFQRLSAGAQGVFLNVTPDGQVFAYTLGLSLLAGLAVGLWPALRATRDNLESALKQDPTGTGRGTRGAWSRRNLLLTAQVAASLVLLAGAGLAFRGAWRTRNTDPGYDTKRLFVLAMNLEIIAPDPAARLALMHDVIAQLETRSEIASIAWAFHPPLLGHAIRGWRNNDGRVERWVLNRVSDRFFETLGLPLIMGRTFTPQEIDQRAAVAVINESAARQMWPGKSPIGQQLAHELPVSWEPGARTIKYTVIGVVQDARLTVLSKQDKVDVLLPQPLTKDALLLVRSRVAPEGAQQSILAALGAVNTELPSQSQMLSIEAGPVRIQQLMSDAPAVVASALGLIALLLASVGVYGVVSFVVTRRTREIGVHIALGAQKGDVIRMVLRQTLRPVAWGAGFGLVGAVGLSVLLTQLLVNPELPDFTDAASGFPVATLLTVPGVLAVVILLAALLPARRATKVDPMVALRCE